MVGEVGRWREKAARRGEWGLLSNRCQGARTKEHPKLPAYFNLPPFHILPSLKFSQVYKAAWSCHLHQLQSHFLSSSVEVLQIPGTENLAFLDLGWLSRTLVSPSDGTLKNKLLMCFNLINKKNDPVCKGRLCVLVWIQRVDMGARRKVRISLSP